jgi:hypothetical protein
MSINDREAVRLAIAFGATEGSNLFKEGRGNLKIEGGSTLRVYNTFVASTTYTHHDYYIEGYYAQP